GRVRDRRGVRRVQGRGEHDEERAAHLARHGRVAVGRHDGRRREEDRHRRHRVPGPRVRPDDRRAAGQEEVRPRRGRPQADEAGGRVRPPTPRPEARQGGRRALPLALLPHELGPRPAQDV
ncbi:MAG: hypothetical protein AVDCRST_MAG41-1963, partial [uncultured Corynebacteriales bacterium]